MPDDFTHTLLALLNDRAVVRENEHDWREIEEALRGVVVPVSLEPRITESPGGREPVRAHDLFGHGKG